MGARDFAAVGGLVLMLAMVTVLAWLRQPRARDAVERWNKVVPGVRVSTPGTYRVLTDRIKARRISKVKIRQVSLFEANPLSFRRRYLRVRRENLVYFILCAPLDKKDLLISCWLIPRRSLLLSILSHTPGLRWLGKAIRAWRSFDLLPRSDAEAHFRDVVHRTVVHLAEELNPGAARSTSQVAPRKKRRHGR